MEKSIPKKILQIGYNTIEEAYAKGLIQDDVPETFEAAYNFGSFFDKCHIFIPFGRKNQYKKLTESIFYHEMVFPQRDSLLRLLWTLLHFFRSALALRRMVAEIEPDVIQIGGPNIPNIVFMLSGLHRKYPTVCFIEAFWEDILLFQETIPWWIKKLLPWYYRFTYRFYRIFLGTPSLNPSYYTKRGMTESYIADWQQPVDLRLINAARGLTVSPEVMNLSRPRLITVGRLHAEKCCLDAIEVLKCVRDIGIDASLILVGDGPQRMEVEERIDSYGLHDKVVLTGQLSILDGLAAVWEGDVYFAPMQGSALLEALATGRPIVAYDHETHRSLIRHQETGILVAHRDVDAAAKAVISLVQNPDYAHNLGENARRDSEKKLDLEQVIKRVWDGHIRAYNERKNIYNL